MLWCYEKNNWITSAHVPGLNNTTADVESRSIHDNMEWQLHPGSFEKICNKWGIPEIDLFASRLNHQVGRYYTWKPDPGAEAVDTFTEDWSRNTFYAFPPFNLVGRVLKKTEMDKAEGIIVVPFWPTQAWFSKFTTMCNDGPYILFNRRAQPTLKHPWRTEAYLPNTRLLVAPVSAQPSSHRDISETAKDLLRASWRKSTHKQYKGHIKKWSEYCSERKVDSASPDIEVVIDFLSQLFEKGLGYSCINSAQSALSTFSNMNNNPVGQHPLGVRLMKGIFNKRPNLPKNNITWDPEIVLNYLKTLSPIGKLNLINLSIKTVALILILTGQRGQSLHLLDIRNVTVSSGNIKLKFGDILKNK